MQAVTNVRNPDIIRNTCRNGCSCFREENGLYERFRLKPIL